MSEKKLIVRSATQEETDPYFEQLIDEHIKPNRDALAKIWTSGEIAVVIADPPVEFVESLELEGWKGETVFPITPRMKREKQEDCERVGDFFFTRWSASNIRKGRVLLYHGYAAWLLNFGPDAWII